VTPEDFAKETYEQGVNLLAHLVVKLPEALHLDAPEDDPFGQMAVIFAAKQVEHLRSLHALLKIHCIGDAAIVARAMAEARLLLEWASKDKHNRGSRWLKFSLAESYKHLELLQNNGIQIDNLDSSRTNLAEHYPELVTNRGSFRNRWVDTKTYITLPTR